MTNKEWNTLFQEFVEEGIEEMSREDQEYSQRVWDSILRYKAAYDKNKERDEHFKSNPCDLNEARSRYLRPILK